MRHGLSLVAGSCPVGGGISKLPVDWIWDNGIIKAQEIERAETEIKRAPKSRLYETQVREYKNFLSSLKRKL